MASLIRMPQRGLSEDSAILSKWYVKEGDTVKKGDFVFAIETGKATFDVESEEDGTVLKCIGEEGDEVPVKALVCVVGQPGESFQTDDAPAAAAPAAAPAALKPDMFSVILIAVVFCAWNIFNAGAIGGFYPAYLADVHHMDTQLAGSVASITNILVLALGPISGIVADKFNLHKSLMVFAMIGAVIMLTFAFGNNLTLPYVVVSVYSIVSACCATGVFSSVPLYARDPAKIGLCMAIVAFLQNLGGVIGAAAFGPLAASLGWNSASLFFCVPVAVVGLVCAVLIRPLVKKD